MAPSRGGDRPRDLLRLALGRSDSRPFSFRGLLDVGRTWPVEQRRDRTRVLFALLTALLAIDLPDRGRDAAHRRKLETRCASPSWRRFPACQPIGTSRAPDVGQWLTAATRSHPVRQIPSIAARLVRSALDLLVISRAWRGSIRAASRSSRRSRPSPSRCPGDPAGPRGARSARALVRCSLTRFYLDALLGLVAIRTHGAERRCGRARPGAPRMDRSCYDRLRASS